MYIYIYIHICIYTYIHTYIYIYIYIYICMPYICTGLRLIVTNLAARCGAYAMSECRWWSDLQHLVAVCRTGDPCFDTSADRTEMKDCHAQARRNPRAQRTRRHAPRGTNQRNSRSKNMACLFLQPRPWQFEIWDSTDTEATYLFLGFETLNLKFCDLKLWKLTVVSLLLSAQRRGRGRDRRPEGAEMWILLVCLRSVFIISIRKNSNWASQILKANMLLICLYCLKFQIARVQAAKTNMNLWKLTVRPCIVRPRLWSRSADVVKLKSNVSLIFMRGHARNLAPGKM